MIARVCNAQLLYIFILTINLYNDYNMAMVVR